MPCFALIAFGLYANKMNATLFVLKKINSLANLLINKRILAVLEAGLEPAQPSLAKGF